MKIKDIEFTSTQHVLDEIFNMNVKGGSPFGRSAAYAFLFAVKENTFRSKAEIVAKFDEIAEKLVELKPTMATIANSIKLVKNLVAKFPEDAKVEEITSSVTKLCKNIVQYSEDAVNTLGIYGANLIQDGETIMMHSYSSSLMSVFEHAVEMGKKFKVICTESRPLRESVNAANFLESLGVDVTYVSDASMWEFIKTADWCIAGADTLSWDGRVANKMGTALFSELANLAGKPFYIASEVYKLDLRTKDGYRIQLERRVKAELVSDKDFPTMEHIEVINQFFDITSAPKITGLITEFGVIPSVTVGQYWDKIEEQVNK